MTNVRSCLALGVTMAFAIVSCVAFAQDDLDDLLKDLEGTAAKPVVSNDSKTEAPAEAPAEEAPAEEAAAEVTAEAPAEA